MMKSYIYIWILILGFLGHGLHAQENNFWPLGNLSIRDTNTSYALNFNYEPPVLNTFASPFSKVGKYTSLCDSTGKLILYNDYMHIRNAENKILCRVNSWRGNFANTLLLRDPSDPNIVHFFTVNDGFVHVKLKLFPVPKYLESDTILNRKIFYYTGNYYTFEAVKMKDQKGYWIILSNNIDSFYIYKLTNGKISLTKKYKSNIQGISHTDARCNNIPSLKISADGKLLIATYSLRFKKNPQYQNGVILYDFDPETGTLSNGEKVLNWTHYLTNNDTFNNPYKFSYYPSACFSPNDSIIYIMDESLKKVNGKVFPSPIIQMDRYTQKVIAEIPLSNKTLASGGIQLAPNGKIYFGASNYEIYLDSVNRFGLSSNLVSNLSSNFISVIRYPDLRGAACNINENIYQFPRCPNPIYFPNIIYKYMRVKFNYLNDCTDSLKFKNLSDTSYFSHYTWFWGSQDSTNAFEASHDFQHSGKHYVRLRATTPAGYAVWWSDSIHYLKPPKAQFSTQNKLGCQYSSFQFYDHSFSDTAKNDSSLKWKWLFGDGDSLVYFQKQDSISHIYFQSGNYTVKLIFSNGFCTDTFTKTETVNILPAPKPGFSIDKDFYCTPATVKITNTAEGQTKAFVYVANGQTSSDINPTFTFNTPGKYVIHQNLLGPSGCITEDSVTVNIFQHIAPTDFPQFLYITHLTNDNLEIAWQPIKGAAKYYLSNNGQFWEALEDTFAILPYQRGWYELKAVDSCGNVSSIAKGKPVRISGSTNEDEYALLKWNTFTAWTKTGVAYYIVQMQDENGTWKDTLITNDTSATFDVLFNGDREENCFRVFAIEKGDRGMRLVSNISCVHALPRIWLPNAFSPNADSINEQWTPISTSIKNIQVQIYNAWGEQVFSDQGKQIKWNGKKAGHLLPEGIYYYVIQAQTWDNNYIYKKGNIHLIK